MSRKQKHSRSSRKRREGIDGVEWTAEADRLDPAKLPPRRKRFPSSIHKLNKWYFNVLFVLFLCLVGFLFWYGNKFSP